MTVAKVLKEQGNSQREPGQGSKHRLGNKTERRVILCRLGSDCKHWIS